MKYSHLAVVACISGASLASAAPTPINPRTQHLNARDIIPNGPSSATEIARRANTDGVVSSQHHSDQDELASPYGSVYRRELENWSALSRRQETDSTDISPSGALVERAEDDSSSLARRAPEPRGKRNNNNHKSSRRKRQWKKKQDRKERARERRHGGGHHGKGDQHGKGGRRGHGGHRRHRGHRRQRSHRRQGGNRWKGGRHGKEGQDKGSPQSGFGGNSTMTETMPPTQDPSQTMGGIGPGNALSQPDPSLSAFSQNTGMTPAQSDFSSPGTSSSSTSTPGASTPGASPSGASSFTTSPPGTSPSGDASLGDLSQPSLDDSFGSSDGGAGGGSALGPAASSSSANSPPIMARRGLEIDEVD